MMDKENTSVQQLDTNSTTTNKKRQSSMDWTTEHDELLIREILAVEPYLHKPSTVKRGQSWTQISEILNAIPDPIFRVTQRAVRERYNYLEKIFIKKIANEEKSTGTNDPELTEVERGIEDIIAKTKEAALHYDDTAKKNIDAERKKADEVRNKCLETFSESRKRLGSPEDEESPKIRRRGTGSETIAFLQAKAERDSELRSRELDIRQQESSNQQQLIVSMLNKQEDMQKQQQALLMANIQAQQQQMQLFMAMIEKMKKD